MAEQLIKFLRLSAVEGVTGLKKSSIYERIAENRFPRPVPLGDAPNSPVGWIETEIAEWQAARVGKRAAKAAA